MTKYTESNLKLGAFVVGGILLVVLSLYFIGSKRSFFRPTIAIKALFYNVNGLLAGNNVRYAGIDVGTVDKIILENDSSVMVYMVIEKKVMHYIRKNSIVAIGTDGLMGNKLVNINPSAEPAPPIEDGDMLLSIRPVETEEMVRTLSATNQNLEAITNDLRKFTGNLNQRKGILRILDDTTIARNLQLSLASFNKASEEIHLVSTELRSIIAGVGDGKGLAGMLVSDDKAATDLARAISAMATLADSLNEASSGLSDFLRQLNNDQSMLHALSSDTALGNQFQHLVRNLQAGSELLNEDLKALQHSFLLRKYFRKKENKKN